MGQIVQYQYQQQISTEFTHWHICVSEYDHDCRHHRNAEAAKALAYVAPWKNNWDTIKIYKVNDHNPLDYSQYKTQNQNVATFNTAWSKAKGNAWKQ